MGVIARQTPSVILNTESSYLVSGVLHKREGFIPREQSD